MTRPFKPSFRNLDSDVKEYLVSEGKCRKRRDGMVEYRGYYDALDIFFRLYMEKGAYDPLISNLRGWNWEVGDNEYLLGLTGRLVEEKDWDRFAALWGHVIKKRKRLYSQMVGLRRKDGGIIPEGQYKTASSLLISALNRMIETGLNLGRDEGLEPYRRAVGRAKEGRRLL